MKIKSTIFDDTFSNFVAVYVLFCFVLFYFVLFCFVLFCIINSKMNKPNIDGVSNKTKLHPFSDISRTFPYKIAELFHYYFTNPLFSNTFQVLESGIFNFHNFLTLSKSRVDPECS